MHSPACRILVLVGHFVPSVPAFGQSGTPGNLKILKVAAEESVQRP